MDAEELGRGIHLASYSYVSTSLRAHGSNSCPSKMMAFINQECLKIPQMIEIENIKSMNISGLLYM